MPKRPTSRLFKRCLKVVHKIKQEKEERKANKLLLKSSWGVGKEVYHRNCSRLMINVSSGFNANYFIKPFFFGKVLGDEDKHRGQQEGKGLKITAGSLFPSSCSVIKNMMNRTKGKAKT